MLYNDSVVDLMGMLGGTDWVSELGFSGNVGWPVGRHWVALDHIFKANDKDGGALQHPVSWHTIKIEFLQSL